MYCSQCGTENVDAARFCKSCGKSLAAVSPPAPAPPPPAGTGEKSYAAGKSPGVALVLSALIVGLGQLYNGDVKKGLLMLGVAVVLGVASFGLGWFAIAIWSAVDAYQVASGKTPLWS